MKLELTKEELEFLLRMCNRAKLFAEMNITNALVDDHQKILTLLKKLEEAKT